MIRLRSIALLFPLFLGTLSGCATSLPSTPLPDGYAIKSLAKMDNGAPFAVNRTGVAAAVAEGSLRYLDPAGGPGRSLAPAPATGLSFSPDGTRLAAVFATNAQSVLDLFDLQGNPLTQAIVPGRVTSLVWRSDREVLATALMLRKFSFGSELVSLLYSWDTVAPPVATTLSDVTVRPNVAKLPEPTLFASLSMTLSPYGDEIAYNVLKDPPLFKPYLRVAVRHLASGAERQVAEISLGSGRPAYTVDGESLLIGDSHALTRRISLPDGKETSAWPEAGNSISVSPSGSYLLLDNRLYQGDREILTFPKESSGSFLPDGSGLAISYQGTLFLVTGLNDSPPPGPRPSLERLLELRRLRMMGLITDQEFKARRKKLTAP
jgi:WD40 repeat protein